MTAGAAVLTLAELERAIRAADPAALLVPPRILRRVIKKHSGLTGPGLQVPHRKSYVIGREALLAIAGRAVPPNRDLPETVLLFPTPDPHKLRRLPPAATLLKYWRLLFHARVHQVIADRLPAGRAGEAVIRERIRRIGQAEADEARAVLRQENFLLHSHNVRSVYEEFVAVFLELHSFAPHRLRYYFPAVQNLDAVFRVLDADVGAAGLFGATRLAGAPDPTPASPRVEEGEARAEREPPPPPPRPDAAAYTRLKQAAVAAEARGNQVRATILLERAARAATQTSVGRASSAVDRLTARLRAALDIPAAEAAVFRRAIGLLAGPAAAGFWTREARLLYDLQRICLDQEREVFSVDLVEWMTSLGRRPIVRPLPHQRTVHLVRRLRSAALRLAPAHIPEADRKQLLDLLHAAVGRHEGRMRDEFRPPLLTALEDAGLRPRNQAERTASDKIIEELLDRVVDRGFLSMSDLRDALARNRLKLADLSGPGEFSFGDPLLRANKKLAVSLDGVYRRGEVYMRGLQRISSLGFGTRIGRFLTLYLILPFLGAFVALKGSQELVELAGDWIHPHARHSLVAATEFGLAAAPSGSLLMATMHGAAWHYPLEFVNGYSLALTGILLLLLLHVRPFRQGVFAVCRLLWRILRGVFYDAPAGFLRLPPVRAVLQSRAYLLVYLLIMKPLMWSALIALTLYPFGVNPKVLLIVGAIVFLIAEIVLLSPLGMHIEEATSDAMLRGWRLFARDLVPGLFRLVLAFFRRLVDDVERLLYTVDEWLRFRGGEGRATLAVKAVLGFVWFFVTYIVRFSVNLLIEPQINPIKHFPVVTVSHKLVLAFFVPPMTALLSLTMDPALAATFALSIGFCIPGIFGFLVWEFKENWRLYRANQPRDLGPQVVGSHGETVPRLLRPGFHSGTLPKLYARLRRIKGAGHGKPHEELHHVEEAVRRFVERNLSATLAGSKAWGDEPLQVGKIRLASNRIRIELLQPREPEARSKGERSPLLRASGSRVLIDLEEHSGRLVAGVGGDGANPSNGWLDRLPLGRVRAFADALAGFYKAAGVDLVREQVESLLPAGAWFSCDDRGLVVETGPHFEHGVVYDLASEGPLAPRPLDGEAARFRTLPADKLLFRRRPIRWDEWVETWERDLAGKGHRPPLVRGVHLLPLGTAKGRWAARKK